MDLYRSARLVAGLSVLAVSSLTAAAVEREPAEPMKLFADFARFRGTDSTLFVEFYYAFSQRCITYQVDGTQLAAGVVLSLDVTRAGAPVFSDQWLVPHTLPDTSAVPGAVNLVSMSALELPAGEYLATITAMDRNNPARQDTIRIVVQVSPVDSDRVILSDIELSNSVLQGSPESPFYKNTLEVIPNARGIFGDQQLCYLYAEVYNLQADTTDREYFVKTIILDAARREVLSRKKPRKRTTESGLIVEQVVVGKMFTGSYTIGLMIVDSTDSILTSASKRMFVYNENVGIDSTLHIAQPSRLFNIYSAMSEGDLDQEFDHARYEAQDADKRRYDGLTEVDAKRAFLAEFWARRPAGLRDEYMARVEYANRYYRVLGKPGYRTDRGRVHIVYGPPSDYERHPNEQQSRPYEIWLYEEIQGGVIFAFVQRVTNGEYELVHSTHRNEIQDDQWYARYAQTSY